MLARGVWAKASHFQLLLRPRCVGSRVFHASRCYLKTAPATTVAPKTVDPGEADTSFKSSKVVNGHSGVKIKWTRPRIGTFEKQPFPKLLLEMLEAFPHALLLCRVGNFYESYFDQAPIIADLLKIRLTSKSMEGTRYPMAGIPIAQLEKYLEKLVREHNKFVAICEEFRHHDDQGALLRIERRVTRVVTPGTLVDENFIEALQHNYLLAIDFPDPHDTKVELAWIDTSTGDFFTQASNHSTHILEDDLSRIAPKEIVLPAYMAQPEYAGHPIHDIVRDLEGSPKVSFPRQSIQPPSEDTFSAIPLLSSYISETLLEQKPDLDHPLRIRQANTMRVDKYSLKALEIRSNNDGGRSGTLLSVMDKTVTSAGTRLLADRISAPSTSKSEIDSRLALIAYMKGNRVLRESLVNELGNLNDEARLLQKMSIGRPVAEDLLMMAKSIRTQRAIIDLLRPIINATSDSLDSDAQCVQRLASDFKAHEGLAERIEASVDVVALEAQREREAQAAGAVSAPFSEPESVDETEEDGLDMWDLGQAFLPKEKGKKATKIKAKVVPAAINWGKTEKSVLQPNSSPVMSKIYSNIVNVEHRAKRLHSELVKATKAPPGELVLRVIPRFGPILRVGSTKKSQTAELKEALNALEAKGAIQLLKKGTVSTYYSHNHWTKLNSEMQGLLVQLREAESLGIRQLCDSILTNWESLRKNAALTAELDVATSLAVAAEELGLTRPTVNDGTTLYIVDGRHPVAECELKKTGQRFIGNDITLDEKLRLNVITGPNMGGKSTILRQTGLIVAMAQAGWFVPARSADIGIADQIFARIRYSDNIAKGRSSFRVEMDDVTYVLENATDRSLVLLDEFGRGTTAEYAACIAEALTYALGYKIQARGLFATHLHHVHDILVENRPETDALLDRIAFMCTRLEVTKTQSERSLRYLYKLEPGINRNADAFKVAQLSGFPEHLLSRAEGWYEKAKQQQRTL